MFRIACVAASHKQTLRKHGEKRYRQVSALLPSSLVHLLVLGVFHIFSGRPRNQPIPAISFVMAAKVLATAAHLFHSQQHQKSLCSLQGLLVEPLCARVTVANWQLTSCGNAGAHGCLLLGSLGCVCVLMLCHHHCCCRWMLRVYRLKADVCCSAAHER